MYKKNIKISMQGQGWKAPVANTGSGSRLEMASTAHNALRMASVDHVLDLTGKKWKNMKKWIEVFRRLANMPHAIQYYSIHLPYNYICYRGSSLFEYLDFPQIRGFNFLSSVDCDFGISMPLTCTSLFLGPITSKRR